MLSDFALYLLLFFYFFFSSRRRHTRFKCDWSSDVCSSDLKHQVFAFGPGDLRQAQAGLHRHQDKRVIAPPEPGTSIGSSEQSIDFRTHEESDERACEAFAGDGEHTLDLCRVSWQFEGGVMKERVDSVQPQVATARAQALMLLDVIEKRYDQRGIDLFEPQS